MAGDIWFSVLLNNPDATAHAGLSLNPSTNADPAAGAVERLIELAGNSLTFSADGNTLANASKSLAVGQTHLIVGKLTAGDGLDALSIWADPADLNDLGAADLSVIDQDLLETLTALGLYSYNPTGPAGAAAGGYLDALRVSNDADAFRQVTGVPEPSTLAVILTGGLLAGRRRRKH